MRNYFFLAIVLLFCSGCLMGGDEHFRQYQPLITTIKNHHKNIRAYKAIFLVPSSGCEGCITNAEGYLMDKYVGQNKRGIIFIVTGLNSEKTAKIRFGVSTVDCPDVIFDYNRQFVNAPFLEEFPKVFFIRDGEIYKVEEMKPGNSDNAYSSIENAIK